MKKLSSICLAMAAACSLSHAAVEATLLSCNLSGWGQSFCGGSENQNGIRLSHFPAGSSKSIHTNQVYDARFSPDGKQIAFVNAAQILCIMDNEGKNIKSTGIKNVWHSFPCQITYDWTDAGIFWTDSNFLRRYVPKTGVSSLVLDMRTIGVPNTEAVRTSLACSNTCCGSDYVPDGGLLISQSGRKVWLWNSYTTDLGVDPYDPGFHLGACAAGGRGVRPYLWLSSDFKSYTLAGWGVPWGHGQGMTYDGLAVFIQNGEHRHWNPAVYFDSVTSLKMYYATEDRSPLAEAVSPQGVNPPSAGVYPALDPPIPTGLEAGFNFPRCVNHDSMAVAAANNGTNYLYNYKSNPPVLLGTFASCDGWAREFWYGPLPSPGPVGTRSSLNGRIALQVTMKQSQSGVVIGFDEPADFALSVFDVAGRSCSRVSGTGSSAMLLCGNQTRTGIYYIDGYVGGARITRQVQIR